MQKMNASVVGYARRALSVVLDQHDITILPEHVQAIPLPSGDIGLVYETVDTLVAARFTGDDQNASLRLGQVRTPNWLKVDFGTIDRFKGSRPDGTPILVPSRA